MGDRIAGAAAGHVRVRARRSRTTRTVRGPGSVRREAADLRAGSKGCGVRVGNESARRAPVGQARDRRRVAGRLSVPELRAGYGDDAQGHPPDCAGFLAVVGCRWPEPRGHLLVATGSPGARPDALEARGARPSGGAARYVRAAGPAQRRAGQHFSVRRRRFVADCAERGALRPVGGGLLPDVSRRQLQRVAESRGDRPDARDSVA